MGNIQGFSLEAYEMRVRFVHIQIQEQQLGVNNQPDANAQPNANNAQPDIFNFDHIDVLKNQIPRVVSVQDLRGIRHGAG
jgi:hypothetical protein